MANRAANSITHFSHQHPLYLGSSADYPGNSFYCSICLTPGCATCRFYRCATCQFHAHLACVAPPPPLRAPRYSSPPPRAPRYPSPPPPQAYYGPPAGRGWYEQPPAPQRNWGNPYLEAAIEGGVEGIASSTMDAIYDNFLGNGDDGSNG